MQCLYVCAIRAFCTQGAVGPRRARVRVSDGIACTKPCIKHCCVLWAPSLDRPLAGGRCVFDLWPRGWPFIGWPAGPRWRRVSPSCRPAGCRVRVSSAFCPGTFGLPCACRAGAGLRGAVSGWPLAFLLLCLCDSRCTQGADGRGVRARAQVSDRRVMTQWAYL